MLAVDENLSAPPGEVFAILSGDVDHCFKLLEATLGDPNAADREDFGESEVRNYVRAAFACIEGMTFCMNAWMAEQNASAAGGEAPLEQWTDLESNVTSMFNQLDQVMRIEPQLGTGRQWWASFQLAIHLRHRMAHPLAPGDLCLSREEILTIVDADAGFRLLLSRYLEV